MHRCEWITAKYPDELIYCTEEYIPTTYYCLLVDKHGARYKFDGIGNFAADINYLVGVKRISLVFGILVGSSFAGHPKARYSARRSNFWDGHLVQP